MMFADEGGRFVAKLLWEEMLANRQRALGYERGEVERDPEVTSMARAGVEPAFESEHIVSYIITDPTPYASR